MRIPDPGPFGETFLDASVCAIVAASLVNRFSGGKVETVFTPATHLSRLWGALRCLDRLLAGTSLAFVPVKVQMALSKDEVYASTEADAAIKRGWRG